MSIQLGALARRLDAELVASGDLGVAGATELVDVVHDSREAGLGALFACVPGANVDGHSFAGEAVGRGAPALLCDRPVLDARGEPLAPQIVVRSVRDALGRAAHLVHDEPSHKVRLVGVTGTSGKTTVTHLIGQMLEAAGYRCAVSSTLDGPRTTPEATDVCRWLADLARSSAVASRSNGTPGGGALPATALEVSSHALELGRVDGLRFTVGVFLNLGVDHLDFHGDTVSYFEAKCRLFDGRSDAAVVNTGSCWGRKLEQRLQQVGCPTWRFSPADVSDVEARRDGLTLRWRGHRIDCALLGCHNAVNLAAAGTVGRALGMDDSAVAEALRSVHGVAGRMQPVTLEGERQPPAEAPLVLVDYAHKPDALAAVLESARELVLPRPDRSAGRLWVVLGAGGDRDVTKRPMLGQVAAEWADQVVITTDNPRSEDPAEIAAAVLAGAQREQQGAAQVQLVADRAEAIGAAVASAQPTDVVVVAGKGHERTQHFATHSVEFNDYEVAAAALRDRLRGLAQ